MTAKKIGSDIEFLVQESKTKTYIPAGLLGLKARKGHPEQLKHGGIEIDCCGLEITPKEADNPKTFADNILGLMEEVRERYKDHTFIARGSFTFNKAALEASPDAMVMGCEPDFNTYTGVKNPRPDPANTGMTSLRSFGGHIHIEGGTKATVVACDMLLGYWESCVRPDYHRKLLYGRAGAFREKPYGIEYRVLSNFWAQDRSMIEFVWDMANVARQLTIPQIKEILKNVWINTNELQYRINNPESRGNSIRNHELSLEMARKFVKLNEEAAASKAAHTASMKKAAA